MAASIKHTFQSAKTDGPHADELQPSHWNAEHTLTMTTAKILGRNTAGTGAVEEIAVAVVPQSVGFTVAGGTTPKTLTVDETVSLSGKANKQAEVDGHASQTLTAAQVTNTIIHNVGQVAASDQALPAAAAGLSFVMMVSEAPGAYAWRIRAAASDKLYLNGVAGSDNAYVGISTPTVGAFITVISFKTGASTYDWYASVGNGNWVVS